MNQSTPPIPSNGTAAATESNHHSDVNTSAGTGRAENRHEQSQLKYTSPTLLAEQERKLIIARDGEITCEYTIGLQDISIGRKQTNHIQLNDLAMSGNHARISTISDYTFIEDLGSTNGTMVNGNHIKKVALEHGDNIQIGHYQMTYLCEGSAIYEPTMFVKAEQDETQIIYVDAEAPDTPQDRLPLAGLKVLDTSDNKPVIELRKTYNNIGFQNKPMALITRGEKNYTITLIPGPQNRRGNDIPLINGQALDNQQRILAARDIINIAGFELQFYFLS